MRPKSIAWFERLYVASLLIPLALLAAVAAMAWELIRTGVVPLVSLLAVSALWFVLPLALVLLVSRRGSIVAKWVLIAVFAIGLIANLASYRPGIESELSLVMLVITAMQIVAIGLLFTAAARAWMSGKAGPLPSGAELEQTFD
jgi:hypothetical protein